MTHPAARATAWPAHGVPLCVSAPGTQPEQCATIQSAVARYLEEALVLVDRERPNALVHRLAHRVVREPVTPLLATILAEALDAAELTGGRFAPLPPAPSDPNPWRSLMVHWGSDRSTPTVDAPGGGPPQLERLALALVADWAADAWGADAPGGLLIRMASGIATSGGPAGGWSVVVGDEECRIGAGHALASCHDTGEWSRVIVSAPTCALATVACSAAAALGPDGPDWLSEHRLPGLFLAPGGGYRTVAWERA